MASTEITQTSVCFSPSTLDELRRLEERLPWLSKSAGILEHAVHELWKLKQTDWKQLNATLPSAAYGTKTAQSESFQRIRISGLTKGRIETISTTLGRETQTRVLELAVHHLAVQEKVAESP